MDSKPCALVVLFVAASSLLAPLTRAEDDPLKDPDLQKMMKEANELQKASGPAQPPAKMAELQKQANEMLAEQNADEAKEKAALQKQLAAQLAAPGAVALPKWTPATPQFTANGVPVKKIVDDEVRIVLAGTSPLTPDQLADAWMAATADKKINRSLNKNSSNGDKSTTLYLDSREDSPEKVRMYASRPVDAKITEVEISSPLPKPANAGE